MVRPVRSLAMLLPGLVLMAEPAFDPAKDVQISFSRGFLTLAAPAGYHLKGRFLAVTLTQGVCFMPMARTLRVAAAEIPPGGGAELAALPAVADLGGRPFALASALGSVVVDFFASWCGPCRKSLPALDHLDQKYKAQGLKVVGISLDEDGAALARFLDNVPVSFQIAHDPRGDLAQRFQVIAMPTTLLLDRQGKVVARFEGGDHAAGEDAAVAAVLAGKPLPRGTGATLAPGLRATGSLKAWNRGHLADAIMNLDGDPLSASLREHIHASKEGAAGNGGAAGGGCGCN